MTTESGISHLAIDPREAEPSTPETSEPAGVELPSWGQPGEHGTEVFGDRPPVEGLAPAPEAPAPAAPAAAPESEGDLPDKFKGKSATEIANSYLELEKLVGRQSSEIGDLRRQFNEVLMTGFEKTHQAAPAEPEVDFDEDPVAAMKAVVQEETKVLREELRATKEEEALREFTAKHPDYKQLGQSAEMQAWVAKYPHRQEMFNRASQGDLTAADAILTEYKEVHTAQASAVEQEVAQVQGQMAPLASVPGQTATANVAPRKPVYRRADLIDLKVKAPSVYQANYDEIMAAYREKRVI